jgi:molybdopterin molybdotransferase
VFDAKGEQTVAPDEFLADAAEELARHGLIDLIVQSDDGAIGLGRPDDALETQDRSRARRPPCRRLRRQRPINELNLDTHSRTMVRMSSLRHDSSSSKEGFRFTSPGEALDALLSKLGPVGTESVAWDKACGRVLAQPLVADRPSPPCDVSAMDGYAVRLADLACGRIDVAGDVLVGQPALPLPEGKALRIVTGAPIPTGAEAVIRREDVGEHGDHITVGPEVAPTQPGQYVRHAGENARAGEEIVPPGTVILPPVMAAMATFGAACVSVYRKVRVGVLVTGDELLPPEARPEPWQLRDANGPALRAMIASCPWCVLHDCRHVADDPEPMSAGLRELLRDCDAVFITGGVSMGGRDYVPSVVRAAGAEVVFHKLPQRPGKPILAAVGEAGQAIVGLPGNPVSVVVTARRFGAPALARRAGLVPPPGGGRRAVDVNGGRASRPPGGGHDARPQKDAASSPKMTAAGPASVPTVTLLNDDGERLSLWWYRPVRLTTPGEAALLDIRSSGDVAAAARSDGFIELPPGEGGPGPWPFYAW